MASFFKNTSLDEAIQISKEACKNISLEMEEINTIDALSRVTYSPHYSKISSPHFTASAMDGIATCFEYTLNATRKNPILLKNGMYEVVDTGDIINSPFDCVVMIEDVTKVENGYLVTSPMLLYQNIRSIGEDIQLGQMIVSSKKSITPIEMSSLLAAKITKLEVYRKIRVGIIPTGDEIVDAREESLPQRGELIDYNSWTFKALIESYGGEAIRYDIVEDNKEKLREAILKGTKECDIVIVNAGSSKGRGDFSVDVVEELGRKYFHGLAIKPGKPTSIGLVNNTPIYGVPGYPVSAFFVMETILKPGIIEVMNNIQKGNLSNKTIEAMLSKKVVSSLKYDEYVRVKLARLKDKLIASPLGKGGSTTMSLVNADGYFIVPKNSEGLEASSKVRINILRDDFNPENNILSVGSYDPAIEILNDVLKDYSLNLSSSYAGSIGGIMSLKKDDAHLAFSSLYDENGEYNVGHCKKYLEEFVIIKFIKRVQGLIVQKGNPLKIKDFKDLERVVFVNRQKGSGTRLLLDRYLEKNSINKSSIKGYDREEITHLTAAAGVKGKSADCTLGILSVARKMDLDFIPVCTEEIDIIIKKNMLEDNRFKIILDIIKSEDFKKKLGEIEGCDFSNIGKMVIFGG